MKKVKKSIIDYKKKIGGYMKPITKIIAFIVLVGMYMFIPYPEVRFLFYIILALAFIKVVDIAMAIKEGFDEIYDAYDNILSILKGDEK